MQIPPHEKILWSLDLPERPLNCGLPQKHKNHADYCDWQHEQSSCQQFVSDIMGVRRDEMAIAFAFQIAGR
jgi:hypothetical protein